MKRLYVASKAKHYDMWRTLRKSGWNIISTWIDEAEDGATSNWSDLWARCINEASSCDALIMYSEPSDVLRGALLEVGAALSRNIPVYHVGPRVGSYHNHPLFIECVSLQDAYNLANSEAGEAQ